MLWGVARRGWLALPPSLTVEARQHPATAPRRRATKVIRPGLRAPEVGRSRYRARVASRGDRAPSYFWLAAQYGARASCYWAFGDEGGAGSSFAAYTAPWHVFSPPFPDPEWGLITGNHMEAIREGAQDSELLALRRQRLATLAAAGVETPAVAAARARLHQGLARVTRELVLANLEWQVPKDRGAMDAVRTEVMGALAALQPRPIWAPG